MTEQARQVLRALLHDKIDCEPFGRGRQRGYRFSGALRIGQLIYGATGVPEHAPMVVAPTAFDSVTCLPDEVDFEGLGLVA